MAAVDRKSKTGITPVALRPLEEGDVAQAAEIERDAFPTLFPPTSFRRALKNKRARYLVAGLNNSPAEETGPRSPTGANGNRGQPLISKLMGGARSIWSRPRGWSPGQQLLAGFVGTWYMVDEAHIVSVGVRTEYRGQGIGELLLIGAIAQAIDMGMTSTTLEVRVSNQIAKSLYRKYGFTERGLRKGYYSDDREDAAIMTAESVDLLPYRERFRRLAEAHRARWGYAAPARP
jgi:ribosomal-protein-alanine N-acetyltransferase